MRGNHKLPPDLICRHRSIPAYAGEPGIALAFERQGQVYPRVCGGTSWFSSGHAKSAGLSPRMRGNLAKPHCPGQLLGSIPAYAGEP